MMVPFLPNDLRMKVKERLRDVRFVAREMKASTHKGQIRQTLEGGESRGAATGLATLIADFSDSALSALESVAIGLLSNDPKAHFGKASAYPLDRYIDSGSATGETLFARDCYFAAKQIVLAKGIANPRLSEELFADAYRYARRGRETLPSVVPGQDKRLSVDEISVQAAIMGHAILQARPVESPRYFEDAGNDRLLDTGVFIASAIALATAVASYHDDLTEDDDLYPSVCAAVEARYSLFSGALANRDRPEDLARIIADLIPHLP